MFIAILVELVLRVRAPMCNTARARGRLSIVDISVVLCESF